VQHFFVAAQAKTFQNSIPLEKLAAPGRVEKAAGVAEKEEGIEGHLHGSAAVTLQPHDARAHRGGHTKDRKGHQGVRRVVAVVSAAHGKYCEAGASELFSGGSSCPLAGS